MKRKSRTQEAHSNSTAAPGVAPAINVTAQLQKLDDAIQRRLNRTSFITSDQRQELKQRYVSFLHIPQGPDAARGLAWMRENGVYLAASGNWDEFTFDFLGREKEELNQLIDELPSTIQRGLHNTQSPLTAGQPQAAAQCGASGSKANGDLPVVIMGSSMGAVDENIKPPPGAGVTTPKRPAKSAKKLPANNETHAIGNDPGPATSPTLPSGAESKLMKISEIHRYADTQIRAAIDDAVVAEYCERLLEGDEFPEVDVFYDGKQFILADGFHRICAAIRAKLPTFRCRVHRGTREDALWFALGANKTNALRRTAADTTNAVRTALLKFPARTQQQIAQQVGCTQQYVSQIQHQLTTSCELTLPDSRKGADGKSRRATYKKREIPKSDPSPSVPSPELAPVTTQAPGTDAPMSNAVATFENERDSFVRFVLETREMVPAILRQRPNLTQVLEVHLLNLLRQVREFHAGTPIQTNPLNGQPLSDQTPSAHSPP